MCDINNLMMYRLFKYHLISTISFRPTMNDYLWFNMLCLLVFISFYIISISIFCPKWWEMFGF